MREMWMNDVPDGDLTPIVTPPPVMAALAITAAGTLVLGVLPGSRDALRRPRRPHRRPRRLMVAAGRAADDIRAAIAAAGGAIPFAEFMELALYGPSGFYTAEDAGGGRSPRRLPDLARGRSAVRRRASPASSTPSGTRLGRPDPFTVVDAGAGPGTLARAVLAAAPGVRSGAALRRRRGRRGAAGAPSRRRRVAAATCPAGPFDGVVLANELLDNLPFRLAVLRRRLARGVRDRRRATARSPRSCRRRSTRCRRCCRPRPPTGRGRRSRTAAGRWVGRRPSRSCGGAGWSSIDYARPTTAELAALPWRAWLRTYRGHERGGGYLADAGRPGHHRRRRPRPAPRARCRAQPGPVPAALGHRRAGRRGPTALGRRRPALPTWRR